MKKVLVILLVAVLLAAPLAGCGRMSEASEFNPPEESESEPSETEEATPIPDEGILYIEAPDELLELWNEWDGKYVMYAHKKSGVRKISDLDGKVLLLALINIEMDTVMGAASSFMEAGGIEMEMAIQNNKDLYDENLLEDDNRIGIMAPDVAEYYEFDENEKLVRIELE